MVTSLPVEVSVVSTIPLPLAVTSSIYAFPAKSAWISPFLATIAQTFVSSEVVPRLLISILFTAKTSTPPVAVVV